MMQVVKGIRFDELVRWRKQRMGQRLKKFAKRWEGALFIYTGR